MNENTTPAATAAPANCTAKCEAKPATTSPAPAQQNQPTQAPAGNKGSRRMKRH